MTSITNNKTVLVVEDDRNLNRLYCKYLHRTGHIVQGVHTISEALSYLLNDLIPDIIVLDFELTDGHGTEILDYLHQRHCTQTKVIVVSGNFHVSGLSHHSNLIDYILLKPISVRELATFVKSI